MMSCSILTRASFKNVKNVIPYIIRGISSTSNSKQVQAIDTIDIRHDLKHRVKVFIIKFVEYYLDCV